MPYEIRGQCVYRRDTGKKVGCTKGSVKKYLAALQINAESNDPEIIELKEIIEKIYGEDKMKLTKIIKEFKEIGNKSTKNVFGDDKTKDSNSDPTKSFEDYPLSYEDAMEKLKGIKDKAKLDRCYEECFAQMDVPHERNMLRAFYKSLRDGMND